MTDHIQPGDLVRIKPNAIFLSNWTGLMGIVLKQNQWHVAGASKWHVFHVDPVPGGMSNIQIWYADRLDKVC